MALSMNPKRRGEMAKDDMEVIQYKILSYLYESLKAGHTASLDEVAWKCKLFDITREYWLVIMETLIDSGYVSGLKYVEAKDMESVLQIGRFTITAEGRKYLTENSTMQKAKNVLGEAFKITLGGLIGRL